MRRVRKSLGDLGVDIAGNTPEEFAAYIKAEIPKWTAIVKASGATLDYIAVIAREAAIQYPGQGMARRASSRL